jgi:hypothetical protein
MHTVWQQSESAQPFAVWTTKQLSVATPHEQFSPLQLGVMRAI